MIRQNDRLIPCRRAFMKSILPGGALFLLGCRNLMALPQETKKQAPSPPKPKHKFLVDSKMTFEDVFSFSYRNGYIPIMQHFASAMGKEKLIEMLNKASSETAALSIQKVAKSMPKNDLAAFVSPLKQPDHFWSHVLTFKIIEDTEKAFEISVAECLWAKAFRSMNSQDIGYASICFPDYAIARAFNPKMKLIRSKTLMEGHDCCNHRYAMEG